MRRRSSAFRWSGTLARAAGFTAATICSWRTPSAPSRATNSAREGARGARTEVGRSAGSGCARGRGQGVWRGPNPAAGTAPRQSCLISSVHPDCSSCCRASCFSSSRAPLRTSCTRAGAAGAKGRWRHGRTGGGGVSRGGRQRSVRASSGGGCVSAGQLAELAGPPRPAARRPEGKRVEAPQSGRQALHTFCSTISSTLRRRLVAAVDI